MGKTCCSRSSSSAIARWASAALITCIARVNRWRRSLESRAAARAGRTGIAVYDIVDAGPRHRFLTHSLLVSNCTLGKGYGMGPATFVVKCKESGYEMPSTPVEDWPDIKQSRRLMFMIRNQLGIKGDPYSEDNRYAVGQLVFSERVHQTWRAANPKVVEMWKDLADAFTDRARSGAKTVAYRLPSGRVKRYFEPKIQKVAKIVVNEEGEREERVETAMSGRFTRSGERRFMNGGKICENLTQAMCRDIMAYAAVEIELTHPTWKYMFSVYDEIITMVPKEDAELAKTEIPRIMTHGELISDWTEGLPLEVDGGIFERYTK